jgi:spermidine synthase
VRTGLAFGLLNIAVAFATLWIFRGRLRSPALWVAAAFSFAALAAGIAGAERFARDAEERLYRGQVVFAEQTPYQRVALLQKGATVRLYLNGRLQFSSRDEYRYHEALVHPAMAALAHPQRVLVLGGGDGLAVREILRYPSVQGITLVDIDARVTDLFRTQPRLAALNAGALSDRRVRIVNEDAWRWLESRPESGPGAERFDAVFIDLPDPSHYGLGRLYTAPFYRLVMRHLAPAGLVATQATSPIVAREAFWCIVATLEAAELRTAPYHAGIPSFGDWGFVIASREGYREPARLPEGLGFITLDVLRTLFVFSPDSARLPVQPNRLDTQELVRYYEIGWRRDRE